MSLNEFHNMGNDEGTAQPQLVSRNWAEVMDETDPNGDQSPLIIVDRSVLPTAPKSVLGPDIDMNLVPKEKPFRANVSNISFEADENSIKTFFKDCKVSLSVYFV